MRRHRAEIPRVVIRMITVDVIDLVVEFRIEFVQIWVRGEQHPSEMDSFRTSVARQRQMSRFLHLYDVPVLSVDFAALCIIPSRRDDGFGPRTRYSLQIHARKIFELLPEVLHQPFTVGIIFHPNPVRTYERTPFIIRDVTM